MIRRYELSDADWKRIEPLVKGKPGDVGRSRVTNRLFINAVIWLARSGAAWRDLPERYGPWNSVYRRFRRWVQSGHWQAIFQALQDPGPCLTPRPWVPTSMQQTKKSTPANEALGRSRGGLTTKIHAVVDALGNPLRIDLTAGQRADSPQALLLLLLLEGLDSQALIADKAYNTNAIIDGLTG